MVEKETIQPINTHLFIYRGVGISREQNFQVPHKTKKDQNTWFNNYVKYEFKNASYIRENGTLKVEIPFKDLRDCNYISFTNKDYDNKTMFAFIDGVSYISPKVSEIMFSIDIIQTYWFDVELQGYVEKQHMQEYFSTGEPVQNIEPEGLYYGDEYRTVKAISIKPHNRVSFLVIVSTEPLSNLENENIKSNIRGVFNHGVSSLSYTLIPFDMDSRKHYIKHLGVLNTCPTAQQILSAVYNNEKWANKIVGLYYTDNPPFDPTVTLVQATGNYTTTIPNEPNTGMMEKILTDSGVDYYGYTMTSFMPTLKKYDIGSVYEPFSTLISSKLKMYPYSIIVIQDFKGNILELKPEKVINRKNGKVNLEMIVKSVMGNNPKTIYAVKDYISSYLDNSPYQHEHSIIDDSLNDLPIIVSNLSALMQSQRNTIEAQRQNAQNTFKSVKSNAQANTVAMNQNQDVNTEQASAQYDLTAKGTVDIAMRNAELSGQITGWGMGSAMGGQVGGLVGGAMGSGGIGSTVGSIGGGILGSQFMGNVMSDNAMVNSNTQLEMNDAVSKANANFNNRRLSINNNLSNQMMLTSANASLENMIRGVNAKISDAENIAPTINKMGGNNIFDFATDTRGLYIAFKTVSFQQETKLDRFFQIFGYTVNSYTELNIYTRKEWNFIKTIGLNVKGDVSEVVKNTFRTVFDKGVFLFHNHDLGNFKKDNFDLLSNYPQNFNTKISSDTKETIDMYNIREVDEDE